MTNMSKSKNQSTPSIPRPEEVKFIRHQLSLTKLIWWTATCQLPVRLRERKRWLESAAFIANSRFFDDAWYLTQYPDVAAAKVDPAIHYLQFGADEGRDPSPLFDSDWYLTQYPDVAAAAMNPLLHFLRYGRKEGRHPNPSMSQRSPKTTQSPSAAKPEKPVTAALWSIPDHQPQPGKRSKQTILFVSHDAKLAGSQILLLEIIRYFTQLEDFDCYVLLCRGGELEDQFKELAKTCNLQNLLDTGLSRQQAIHMILKSLDSQPGVMAFCNTVVTGDVAVACSQANIPVLSYIHELPSSIETYVGQAQFLKLANCASSIVVVSDFVRQELASFYNIDPHRFVTIHAGVRYSSQALSNRQDARARVFQELQLPESTVLILGCGSVHHRKGADLFVQLARQVLAAPNMEGVRFIWVGPDQEGPHFRRWCEHDIRILGMEDQVSFVGIRTAIQVEQYFAAADIFTLTSREDPFPLVNLEAMAHGLPIVAFQDAGGASEALIQNAGIVVPYLDVATMAKAVVALAGDETYRQRIGRAAKERCQAQYQWSRYMDDFVKLIQQDFYSKIASTNNR